MEVIYCLVSQALIPCLTTQPPKTGSLEGSIMATEGQGATLRLGTAVSICSLRLDFFVCHCPVNSPLGTTPLSLLLMAD